MFFETLFPSTSVHTGSMDGLVQMALRRYLNARTGTACEEGERSAYLTTTVALFII